MWNSTNSRIWRPGQISRPWYWNSETYIAIFNFTKAFRSFSSPSTVAAQTELPHMRKYGICGITLSWFQPFNSTEIKELLWMDPTHLGHKLSLESLREVLGPLLSTSVIIYGPNLARYQIICRWLHCASSHSWSFWSANSAAGHWYSTSLKLQLANEFQWQKCYILTVSHKCQKDVRSYTLGNITLLPVESFTYLGVTYLRT